MAWRWAEMARFWRMTPAIALTLAIALLVAGVLMGVYNERAYEAQKSREVRVQAQILASSVTAALVFDDPRTAQEYVNALKANPEIQAAAVYDADGHLFADYLRDAGSSLPETVEPREPFLEHDRLVVIAPVVQGAEVLGTVYLRSLVEPFARRLTRYGAIGLLITMASLVVGVLGAAHAALTKANAELHSRAVDLAEANRELHAQIAEREKAEEALRQSQKMEALGQLSGGIAHDFNNLLTIVKGNLEFLQKRIAEGRTDVGRYVDLAMDGLNRASSVTQRVLAFSRRQPLSPKPVNLTVLIAEMGELMRHSVGKSVTVEVRLQADWWTLCDPSQMENVVLNLAINARDAMPDGGRLTFETENVRIEPGSEGIEDALPGEYVRLSVTDTGMGMSDEVRQKAFDPFFTTKPQGQGTGLGLSMIFGYVKQSKGFLSIDSGPGRGTRVTILMPRHELEAPAETSQPPAAEDDHRGLEALPASASAATGMATILIVEDEALVRMLAAETLRDEGYNVLEQGDGSTALTMLRSDPGIDLLITDVKLPGMDGYQLAEAALGHRPGLKVLLMTGYAQPAPDRLAAAKVQVLHKPYTMRDLTSLTRACLDREASSRAEA